MKAAAIIPARYASSRLPGKLLLKETGKYVMQYAWEACQRAARIERTIVAADDPRVVEAAESFGALARLTSPDHPSGTDRVAEVARELNEELVLGVQGDEVELAPEDLDLLVEALAQDDAAAIATLATPLRDPADLENPNVVKVVVDAEDHALYFSRCPIPHGAGPGAPCPALKHRGVYAWRRDALLDFTRREPAPLERTERLEQLRALHHGLRVRVVHTGRDGLEINTPDDYQRFRQGGTP